MSELFFTSDLHFGHKFMADLRGFGRERLDEHDESIIDAWNSVAGTRDEIHVLGDFSFHGAQKTEAIFSRLNGHKYLYLGNHDHKHTMRLGWEFVKDFGRVKHDGQSLWCFHYPMLTWPNAHHGTWHLHGHSHGNLQAPSSTRMDVGPDATGRVLTSIEQVREFMADRSYDFVDHHDKDSN